jgi:DNA-binding MarR family transcriptional regulator
MRKKTINSFSEEMMRLMPQIVKGVLRRQSDALTQGRITIPQFLTLILIDSKLSVKMKDIAKEFNISLPAATGIIARLFKMSFVKRVYDDSDRRIIRVVLTPKGKKIVEQVKTKRKKFVESVFGKLSERERQAYLRILRKLMIILYPVKK